jgi:heme-degrading monooxygenase HmoA
MIAVIFEGWTDPAHGAEYLDLAAQLRPLLDDLPGFISVERFRSLADPEKLLSLSFWESEAAVAAWRAMPEHRAAQARGRAEVFRDYRIRIADVSRDYTLADHVAASADSRAG